MTRDINWTTDFTCLHCRRYVSIATVVSGVRNRNHCPYCLWSKHLDLYQPGDRLSACKSGMAPVGLTLKHTWKKYTSRWGGELMVVHCCEDCSVISVNRIAADDDPQRILEVFRRSVNGGVYLERSSVNLLGDGESELVKVSLFGEAC